MGLVKSGDTQRSLGLLTEQMNHRHAFNSELKSQKQMISAQRVTGSTCRLRVGPFVPDAHSCKPLRARGPGFLYCALSFPGLS